MTPRDPFTDPFCRPEDLGLAIPDSDHAVAVCLPTWKDVIGYEEKEERVIEALECGYPRFVEHPLVAELFSAAQEEFAREDELTLVFPTLAAAWRCADFVKGQGGGDVRLESYGWNNLTVLLVKREDYPIAWKGWQHVGEIVSSRLAACALTDAPVAGEMEEAGEKAIATLRERIAEDYPRAGAGDVFLFSSGMGAISAIHRVAIRINPGLPTIQLEFPYLDVFKIQDKCNEKGVVDFTLTENGGAPQVAGYFESGGKAAALFTEVPSNPLLRTPDLQAIAPHLEAKGVPLIVDDTVATAVNVDAMKYADAVTTSLTKSFSGEGDVAAGAVILNRESPHYEMLREELAGEESASPLFSADAITLEINSRHYRERVLAMNDNTVEVVSFLDGHPAVEKLWFPSLEGREYYDHLKREGGGYGGLFSMKVKGGEAAAETFYDRIRISKGPSLGTNFSLISPYTLMAFYDELEWAAERGVPRDLIRVSIGLEEPDELIGRFEEALG